LFWTACGLASLSLAWFFLAQDVPNWPPRASDELSLPNHWSAPVDQVGIFGHFIYRFMGLALLTALGISLVATYLATLRSFQHDLHGAVRWIFIPVLSAGLVAGWFNWGWFSRTKLKRVDVDLKELPIQSSYTKPAH